MAQPVKMQSFTTNSGTTVSNIITSIAVPNKLMSPAAGNDAIADKNAAASSYVGQIGMSWYGNKYPFLWWANSVGTGSNNWRSPFIFGSGISQSGSEFSMPWNAGSSAVNGMHVYFNGNPLATRFSEKADRNGSCMFIYNMNPFSDGNFYCAPMMTTNTGGRFIGNNADGVGIWVANEFGIQMGSIPETYYIGETNQAGSYVILSQNDYPTYFSINATSLPGESGGFYSQHYWMGFDARSVQNSADDRKLGVHFPMFRPYVWTFTNANNIDALFIDEKYGHLQTYTNVYVGGALLVTNHKAYAVFGREWAEPSVHPNIGVWFTTNTHHGANGDPVAWTWDAYTVYRFGIVKQDGQYPKWAHASGSPFTIARSSASDLQSSIAAQTLTTEFEIDSTGAITMTGPTRFTGTSNYFVGNLTYKTNQNQIVPDFSMPVQLQTTNANFTFLTPIGVDATKTTLQTTAIYVTNSAGNSTLTVTAPANVHPVGTMNVTNLTRFTFECYAQKFTNVFAVPIF